VRNDLVGWQECVALGAETENSAFEAEDDRRDERLIFGEGDIEKEDNLEEEFWKEIIHLFSLEI
jgi:hypothetical protein